MSNGDYMKFSVAMCTYNGAAYLEEQLDSIAQQTRLPNELVVCDDNSSDESLRILQSFAARSAFPVRLHLNESNLGSTKNFEKAICLCDGDIIALADQDDVWHPEKLALLEREFSSAPHVGLVFTDAEIVDENLRTIGPQLWKFTFGPGDHRLVKAGKPLCVLLRHNVITGATMAFRAKFNSLISPIPANLCRNLVHDNWIALVVASVASVSSIPKPLIKYRQHSNQQLGVLRHTSAGHACHNRPPSVQEQADFYLATRNLYAELRERMLQASSDYDIKGSVKIVEAKINFLERQAAHMHSRSRVTALKNKVSRVPPILIELMMLRYRRYSNGLRSAVRDFL